MTRAFPRNIPLDHKAGDATGGLAVQCDLCEGVIRVTASGFLAIEVLREHFRALETMIPEFRRSFGALRMIVDARTAAVQSKAMTDFIAASQAKLARDGDKIAQVVQSPLLKMQLNRIRGTALEGHFADMEEAERWLKA